MPEYPNKVYPAGYQSVTANSSVAVTVSGTGTADQCLIRVEGSAVRWRDDGTAPTASVGVPLAVGEVLSYNGEPGLLKIISQGSTATINISYYTA